MSQGIGIFRAATQELIGVAIDLRLSEIHTAEAVVTETPVEDGSVVTDHIVIKPDTVEIIAEVSNFDANGAASTGERVKTAWQQFKDALNSRQLFDVVTLHELYENMAFESLTGEHSAPYKGKMAYKITFKKVDFAQLQFVAVPESNLQSDGANPVAKSGSSEVEGGRVDSDRDSSILNQATDSLFGRRAEQ